MMKRLGMCCMLLCTSLLSKSQTGIYKVQLSGELWGIAPKHYYLESISDRRKDTLKLGAVLAETGGKHVNVIAENGFASELSVLTSAGIARDTSLMPIRMLIEQLTFKDAGTIAKHTVSMDFKLKFVSVVDGEEIELYQGNGNPEMQARGVPKNMVETILKSAFKQIFQGFDNWVNEHPDQPPLCKSVRVTFLNIQEKDRSGEKDTIRWSAAYRLKWDDFQSGPDKSSPFAAQSHCLFDYKAVPSYENRVMILNTSLFCCFAKKGSWVRADSHKDELLGHEQLHFDICEMYVRKLRKSIQELPLKVMTIDAQIKVVFEQAWTAYQEAQNKYDEETQHGTVADKQKAWKEEVDKQLEELNAYRVD